MAEKVVVTGGTGLVGRQVCKLLIEAGHEVRSLSRSGKSHPVPGVTTYVWNVAEGRIDSKALEGATAIIHLAGENIAEGRWTSERRRLIWDSRVQSAALLHKALSEVKHEVHSILGASAIGYYAPSRRPIDEEGVPGTDFPAEVCKAWEQAEMSILPEARHVILRIGIVLSREGGAFPKLSAPVRYGIGTWLGNGEQVMSWIHNRDLGYLFLYALEHKEMTGVYNGVSLEPCSQQFFLKQVARYLHRPLWPIGVPAFVLRMFLGDMAQVVLEGATVTSSRLQQSGFRFRYPHLYDALGELCRRRRS